MSAAFEAVQDSEYELFLDRLPADPGVVLGYHYLFHLRFLRDHAYPGSDLRMICARNAAGQLAGVMPALHVRRDDVGVWLSLPYFGPNGGALTARGDTAVERMLVAGARADAEACGCDSMTICAPIGALPDLYRSGLGEEVIEQPRATQILPFSGAADASPWPARVRADLRRAARLGVEVKAVETSAELRGLWNLYAENCGETGIPMKPWPHVSHLFATAGERGIFLVARHDGQTIAGLVCLTGGRTMSYYLPCTRRSARPLQPGLALLDTAVARARERGCSLLNFEASPGMNSPVHRFKARCGGRDERYSVFVKLLKPGALARYRSLGRNELAERFPHAFIVPYDLLN